MKEKEAVNVEDVLAQLNNSRTQHNALISLFNRLKSAKISNVQRTRLLKTVAHTLKDGNSTDLRVAALSSVLPWVASATNAASGADFHLLETCTNIVQKYVANSSSQHIDVVAKALEIISLVNVATVVKLFGEDNASCFKEIMTVCLKLKELRLHALTLLAVGLSVPSSEGLGKTISENIVPLIQLVYPLIFNVEDTNVHLAALRVMKGLKLSTKPQPFWNQLKEETQKNYCKQMVEMVNCKANWPEVWKCIVNLFGEELHSGGQLINHMLEVLERAFKHSDFEWTRVQAFECWNTLIDNFKTGLKNRKRIDLIMIPLKANNHRIETLAMAKLKTYDHLLATLGKDLVSSPDILINFLTFCFGSEKTSSCPPVKSYPALHDKCVECILNILVSPFGEEMFKKAQKELVTAVGECFILDSASGVLLSELWNRLLERVWKQEGTDAVKTLFIVINSLVVRAGNKEINGNLKLQQTMSPSKPTSQQLNEVLGCKIVEVIVYGLVLGAFSLPENLFKTRSLYVGSYDVMNGTPTLLMMEWLLSPALMLSAGALPVYDEIISKLLKVQCQELDGYMEFTQLVLKKLLVFDENLSSDKKQLMYQCATQSWCTLASGLIKFIQKEGSINQGDAAEHDFSGIYSVLLFPVQSLHVDIKLIEKCSDPWSNLFYEVCQQAELIPTASLQLVCEQVCIRFLGASRKNSPTKQHALVYFFLTCILEVASKRFKSKKSVKFVEQQISTILKDMNGLAFNQDVIFDQATNCIKHCLKQTPISMEVVENVSPTVCSLLKAQIDTSDAVDKLCTLIGALKEAALFIYQHGSTKESVYAMLKNILDVGKDHTSQEIRGVVGDLCKTFNEKNSEGEEKSQSVRNKGAFSPSSRFSFSPKPASKKFPTVQMSPSNLSPGGSKRKLQATVCGSDGKFVRIETPPKKIILTDHQKEVRRERRQDIPALYQDLSQDTQSISQDSTQDFVALPATPKGKCAPPLDEDAIMDVVHSNTSMQALSAKKTAPSPKSTKKSEVDSEPRSELKSFTPPLGFILPSITEDAKSVTDADNQDLSEGLRQEGKENENGASNSKVLKLNKAPQKGTLTRSSSNTSLTTRSGKTMMRASITGEPEVLKKRKYTRKSLPAIFAEEPVKKGVVETVVLESDTDTESVSSIASDACGTSTKGSKSFLRSRRSLKREVSLESDTEVMAANEKMRESQNGADKVSKDVVKPESPKMKVDSDLDQSKSDIEDVPLSQLIGGKILTRSRSNSSLDDVAVVKKNKTSSPDSKEKPMNPVAESNPKLKGSPQESECKSPRKKTAKIEVSPNSRRNYNGFHAVSDSPVLNVLRKSINTSEGAQNLLNNSNASSPSCLDQLFRVPSKGASLEDKPNVEKEKQAVCKSTSSLSSGLHTRKELNGLNDHENIEFENGTEESQEIIESSQEPSLIRLKPCLVTLEHFRCIDANKTVEFENLTLEKGPAPNSPYKILSKDSSPVEASACRRSLILDGAENSLSPQSKEVVSPPKSPTPAATRKSPTVDKPASMNDKITSDNGSKKLPSNAELENKGMIKTNLNKEGKEQDPAAVGEENHVRNDSMPEWMHDKKDSPLTKSQRAIRSSSARSQAFMKSVADSGSSSSPPKAVDVSPISSPGQSKRSLKTSADANTTPIIKRSSRAAQLLGLGQAAAARGGDTVISSASRSLRMDKTGDQEKTETLGNTRNSIPSSSIASSVTTSVMGSVSAGTTVASPSVRRHKLLDLESLKSTPQKCLEDQGNKEDWVPRVPGVPMATPDSSILKRKREVDSDAPSPCVKRKRVSFRDPPFSTLLKFGETSEGTVFTSDQPTGIERVSEVVNVDHEECAPTGNNEVEIEEQTDQLSEPLSFDMGPKINGKGSPQEKKDSVVSLANSSRGNSPQKSDSVSHGGEGITNVVEVNSTKLKSEALPGRNDRKEAALVTSIHNDTEGDEEMEVDELCECPAEGGSEEPETQGMLDDLLRMPSILTPICANLTDCTHSVELVSSKLTSAAWKKSLLRELSEGGIRTVGDLARLTEEQLDRLPVKPPKRTNVCCVLEDFEKQHHNLADGVSCQLLKNKITTSDIAKHSLEDLLTNSSNEDVMHVLSKVGIKLDLSKALVQSLPTEDIIKFLKLEELIKFFTLEELIPFFKLKDLIKFFKLEELMKFFKLGDVLQLFKLEDVIQFYKPEDVIQFYKPGDVVKHFKAEDLINSLKAEDVSRAVGSLHVDVCAEAYISRVNKSSGSKEKEMSVEQLTCILNRVPGGTIQSTLFPLTPTLLSTVYTDTMRDYVMRECSSSEIVQKLDGDKANECVLKLLPKLDSNKAKECVFQMLPKLDSDKAKECVLKLLPKLDIDKAKECVLKLLPKLDLEVIAQELDSTIATELNAKLLSKFSPSVIAEQIEDDRVEETIKALLSKLNKKRSLRFLLAQSSLIAEQFE